jgi:crotonobetaine/carnitine-CoA ligase
VSELVIDRLLAARAAEHPDRAFLRFREGDRSFAQVDTAATELAHGLAQLGVAPGALVASLLPNCLEAALLGFAVARRGAAHAPINTAFRGRVLAHVLNLTEADVLVVDDTLVEAVADVAADLAHLRRVVVRGDARAAARTLRGLEVGAFAALHTADHTPIPRRTGEPDLAVVLFTSGTTGRSKGCMLSHRYVLRQAELLIEHYELRADDVLYSPFPLFHLDALVMTVMPALVLGTTAAIGVRFSASGFWDEVRDFGATVFDFMGATLTILHKRPPAPDDDDNPVRLAWGVPVPEWAPQFEERFGLRLVELYGSTDAGIPIYQPLHEPRRTGSCGRANTAYDVRLVDEVGRAVSTGAVGEITVRPREPSLITDGYYGMPAETAAVMRDGWFHTGDLATRDDDGHFFFVGRRKDAIRRRGENISAFEVEEVVLTHPDVLDAAAYGVPSDLSEEEVMVALVARAGHTIDPADVIAHCSKQMAAYMVPRYVDVLDCLPLTPTEKVEKYRLVQRGVTPSTWDREADGR